MTGGTAAGGMAAGGDKGGGTRAGDVMAGGERGEGQMAGGEAAGGTIAGVSSADGPAGSDATDWRDPVTGLDEAMAWCSPTCSHAGRLAASVRGCGRSEPAAEP